MFAISDGNLHISLPSTIWRSYLVSLPPQYSPQGSAVCYECPEGHFCFTPDSDPVPCKLGEFSNGTSCRPCPQGFYCPDPTLEPFVCPEGLYSDATGSTYCSVCPVGHSCYNRSALPTPCEAGTYSLAGDSDCMVSTNVPLYTVLQLRNTECVLICSTYNS